MPPPVSGKAPAKKWRSTAKQPAGPPLCNVVPDSVDLRDRPYRPAVAFAPRPRLPAPPPTHRPRLNQHDTSACTGFALATVVHVLTSRRDSAPADPVSAFMLYGMARRYDDLRGEAPDGGSSLRGALKGWFKQGVCKQSFWPKLDEPGPTGKPDRWDDGVRRPLGAYYRVDSRSVVDMQVALNETGVLLGSALAQVLGYKRSLLYLISNALEEQAHVPVLGMAKFFDTTVAPRNLPHLQYRVAPSSMATGATKHGNVDDDGKTQASVLAHIQGKPIPAP